jgi:hypothetical protein
VITKYKFSGKLITEDFLRRNGFTVLSVDGADGVVFNVN